jgi:hypothetical protein
MLRTLALALMSIPLVSAATLDLTVTATLSGVGFSDSCSESASGGTDPLSIQCHLEFLPTGKDLTVVSHTDATADFGRLSGNGFGRGNLAQEDPPFNYFNHESVDMSFSDAISTDLSGPGFIRVSSYGSTVVGSIHIIAAVNSVDYWDGNPEFDSGLVAVDFSAPIAFSLRMIASVDSDNGTFWESGINSITLYDAEGQQISGFNYATESGVAYNVVGGSLGEVPEPKTWIILATGIGLILLSMH